jgi:hypothetical protein
MQDMRAELGRVSTGVTQVYSKCEEIRTAQVDSQISLQQALSEVARADRGEDVKALLATLEEQVAVLRTEAQEGRAADMSAHQVVEQLCKAVQEQLGSVSTELSTAMADSLRETAGRGQSVMDVISQMQLDLGGVRTRLTDMSVSQERMVNFMSQNALMLGMLIEGRFNIPQIAILVPTKYMCITLGLLYGDFDVRRKGLFTPQIIQKEYRIFFASSLSLQV